MSRDLLELHECSQMLLIQFSFISFEHRWKDLEKNFRLLKIKIFSKQKFFSALKSCRVASFSIFSVNCWNELSKNSFDRCSNNISMIPNFWISVKEEAAALIRCHQRSFIAPEGFFHKNVEGRPKNNHFSSMDDFSSDQKLTSKAELKKNLSSE